ncbi:MAG: glycerol-3-phosphate 1-O-acyltransferase PlsY [Gaiellaceae bacterium]|jgi:glycerol-3-phosphate acyltransferase PlsY
MSTAVLLVLAGYLAGSIPSGYWLVRLFRGEDVRRYGSGNIGGTNVWRNFGARYGLPVVLFDVLKGFVPALVASLTHGSLVAVLAGAAAMLGHWRPLFMGFRRGGKMVATCGGAAIGIAPLVAAVGTVVWALVFLAGRYASLASILAAVSLAPAALLLGQDLSVVIFMGAAALAIIWLHRANIGRLARGEEHRFQLWHGRVPRAFGRLRARAR